MSAARLIVSASRRVITRGLSVQTIRPAVTEPLTVMTELQDVRVGFLLGVEDTVKFSQVHQQLPSIRGMTPED